MASHLCAVAKQVLAKRRHCALDEHLSLGARGILAVRVSFLEQKLRCVDRRAHIARAELGNGSRVRASEPLPCYLPSRGCLGAEGGGADRANAVGDGGVEVMGEHGHLARFARPRAQVPVSKSARSLSAVLVTCLESLLITIK